MMNLCVQTLSSFARIGEESSMRLFKQIGFDCMDLSMFQPIEDEFMNRDAELFAYYRDLRAMADGIGLPFHQMHAPFIATRKTAAEKTRESILRGYDELTPYILKSIRVAGICGVRNLVIHGKEDPEYPFRCTHEEAFRMMVDYYAQFIPAAKENNVTLCVENVFGRNPRTGARVYSYASTSENLIRVVDALNDIAGEKRFGVCLDLGHAGLFNDAAADMVRQLGPYLTCLHVQDNDFESDRHVMPYIGKTGVENACRAMHEIGYDGDFAFECEFTVEPFPVPLLPDILRLLERVGRHLISIAEGKQA